VSWVRARPGKYSFASAAVGTPAHLGGEQLGYDVAWSTPDEFIGRIKAETGMWSKVIGAANIAPL
jgi:hypothetical protein